MDKNKLFFMPMQNQEEGLALLEKIFDVAKPEAVYGEPVTKGEHTVITASEMSVGLGFGYGMGGGVAPGPARAKNEEDGEGDENEAPGGEYGVGGGGGGGGGSAARPIAAIIVGPEGVRVEPIVDVTKVVLAFFTAFGSMFLMFKKMRQDG
ncbi:MAG: hypothetical protein ACLFTI_00580 [Anaerolineales bacterium]